MSIDELAPPRVSAPASGERAAPSTQQLPVSKTEKQGPPLRALAMVLIALGIVFAGFGLKDVTGEPSPQTATTETASPAPVKPPVKAAAAPTVNQVKSVRVLVLNNSGVTGIAGKAAVKLHGEGWKSVDTGNLSDSALKRTVAYYGTDAAEKQAALQIADVLGIAAEKKPASLASRGSGVIVVLVN